METLAVTKVPRDAPTGPPSHWLDSTPTGFRNPWPSFRQTFSVTQMLRLRFGPGRNFVPVPENREGLVPIQTPDWGAHAQPSQIKATWIGHSSFLIEMPLRVQDRREDGTEASMQRQYGLRVLMDPVFCERMGPAQLVGPRRFSRTPCTLDELPLVDALCISHSHYDHLDIDTVKQLYADKAQKRTAAGLAPLQIFCGLNSRPWFVNNCGVQPEHVTEMDWWDEVDLIVGGTIVRLACTPSQHGSRRGLGDQDHMLWCSFVLSEQESKQEIKQEIKQESKQESKTAVYFAGDTGYRSVTDEDVAASTSVDDLPHCPAFAEIGAKYGPFSLALLPIGCYTPRTKLSPVHCSPEDAVAVHFDVRSQLSVGMHYGTVRGGLSAQYEDVQEPPQLWRKAGEARGLVWDRDFRLCDIGETVVV
ncbi:N-acyl-phosphatidylethanolamine-hydrolyzing phospholipase D [Sporothrix schenckii 1099-18]|uniref:N-acyl-phosphatidylethanolamine-hydrolyzing phospholipase D n=1 Tax=Sporothrix schenckii 1099-18 TaxID=1397361 RepID=A0A0F2MLI0_SPOSC|nr:N-acyl-phosphatidylethanolamine-hydrolyzing phospholipase D [Sporothrix schenckii 1099-18]KJR89700.1 N-acyl-phosphatidylethanolamine-hydrolyzing phospholipase D [Sporothrix schenckii 1099-18]